MHIIIQPITPDDINELAAVFADAYRPENTGEHWTIDTARQVVDYWFNRAPDDMKILARDENGHIVGAFMADIKPWWNGPRMIDGEFFVQTEYQKYGVGTALMRELVTRAIENHGTEEFETITFNPASSHPLKWYKKLGFDNNPVLTVINGKTREILERL